MSCTPMQLFSASAYVSKNTELTKSLKPRPSKHGQGRPSVSHGLLERMGSQGLELWKFLQSPSVTGSPVAKKAWACVMAIIDLATSLV